MEPQSALNPGMFMGPREIRAPKQQPAKNAAGGNNFPQQNAAEDSKTRDLERIRLAELLRSAESVWKIEEAENITSDLKNTVASGTEFANDMVGSLSIDAERASELLKGK